MDQKAISSKRTYRLLQPFGVNSIISQNCVTYCHHLAGITPVMTRVRQRNLTLGYTLLKTTPCEIETLDLFGWVLDSKCQSRCFSNLTPSPTMSWQPIGHFIGCAIEITLSDYYLCNHNRSRAINLALSLHILHKFT